ncbi:hypothetical protein BJ165DRAFT_1418379 [Panaeolus papilionaceus]|nr:hypothetical protein BJ165DRAFT_1418379 [Panaeolus papilionaceus]
MIATTDKHESSGLSSCPLLHLLGDGARRRSIEASEYHGGRKLFQPSTSEEGMWGGRDNAGIGLAIAIGVWARGMAAVHGEGSTIFPSRVLGKSSFLRWHAGQRHSGSPGWCGCCCTELLGTVDCDLPGWGYRGCGDEGIRASYESLFIAFVGGNLRVCRECVSC